MSVQDLVARWFASAELVELGPGERLLRAGEPNRRLFRIEDGSMLLRSQERTELQLGVGNLVGLQSAFLAERHSVWTCLAGEACRLRALDLAVPCPSGRSWEEELMPLVLDELVQRQERLREMQQQQREIEQRLQEISHVSNLGQMAAGVAHELNNALAVLARGSEWIAPVVQELSAAQPELQRRLLALGLQPETAAPTPEQVSARAAELRRQGLGFAAARRVASLPLDEATLEGLLADPEREQALRCFELGATLLDMRRSAAQAAHVVSSLKQLAASDRLRAENVDLAQSVGVALSICRNALKGIRVEVEHAVHEPVQANPGELVQIWTNLIQNACDALQQQPRDPSRPEPLITITSHSAGGRAVVVVSDNGPGIDPAIADAIFEPAVTTKQQGLGFGLGLGLSIVHQTLRRYGGEISVHSSPGAGASFTVSLPHRLAPVTRWAIERSAQRLHAPGEEPS